MLVPRIQSRDVTTILIDARKQISYLTGTVVYCRGSIRRLRTGGRRIVDHALEHLSRDDHGLTLLPTFVDDGLLEDRDILRGAFDAQITTCDHCYLYICSAVVGHRGP